MKKLHWILTLSALIFAGLGVFVTNAKTSNASISPVIDEAGAEGVPCSLEVTSDCNNATMITCTFTGTVDGQPYTNVPVKDLTASCGLLTKRQ